MAAALLLPAGAAGAAPSTLSPVIGSALLCRSQLDHGYFRSWLSSAYGPPYKREGGAWWFKAEGTLWGERVTDIIVGDDTSELVFVGAVTETTPGKLEQSVRKASGVRHVAIDGSAFPERRSVPGSKIVHFNTRSKIYCARYKPLPAVR